MADSAGPATPTGDAETAAVPPNDAGIEAAKGQLPAAPRPLAVHEAVRSDGEADLRRPAPALFWSALAAGLSIGFSFAVPGLIHARLPDAPWRPLATSLGYTVGFLLVILGRQQLFTQDTLTVILPLLDRPTRRTFALVARVWGLVLAGNLVGASLVGWAAARAPVLAPEARAALAELTGQAAALSTGEVFARGVVAGWLIAGLVWLLPVAEAGRVAAIVAVTWVVALGGFPQVVTATVAAGYAVGAGIGGFGDSVAGLVAPALLGNILGGVVLVAVLNHAQAVTGEDRHQSSP